MARRIEEKGAAWHDALRSARCSSMRMLAAADRSIEGTTGKRDGGEHWRGAMEGSDWHLHLTWVWLRRARRASLLDPAGAHDVRWNTTWCFARACDEASVTTASHPNEV